MTTVAGRDAARPSCPCPPASCWCAAWALTAAISPRPVVRVAGIDAAGAVANVYDRRARLDAPAPAGPWAVHLADASGSFRLLGFDLDAHRPGQRAAADAERLVQLLAQVGIAHVVCASGPSGGRHVWVALDHGAPAGQVASLARLARHVLPTLDIAPLSNPATGCLRPPLSPHRDGGASVVLAGDLDVLTTPATSARQVGALHAALAALVEPATAAVAAAAAVVDGQAASGGAGAVALDEHGHPHLSGPRRALPPASAAAATVCGSDASATMFSVLLGAARARWRHGEVAALAEHAPGLEHLRTLRSDNGTMRRARPVHGGHSGAAVLTRQWARAVATVAASASLGGDDPTFEARAGAVAEVVRAVLQRAEANPTRWAAGGGPADWRALQVLAQLAAQAVTVEVEVASRRLGELAGFSHESARHALGRLAADGWIVCVRPAAGRAAPVWTFPPPAPSTAGISPGLPQVDTRPLTPPSPTAPDPAPGVGAAERRALLSAITATVDRFAHDAFTHAGLGLAAGNVYAASPSRAVPMNDLVKITGASRRVASTIIEGLADHGLLASDGARWWRPEIGQDGVDRREAVAAALPDARTRYGVRPVAGTMARRAGAHRLDQAVWDWWCAEIAWRKAPRRTSAKRRPGRGQLSLMATDGARLYGPFPTKTTGRDDHARARAILAAEATTEPDAAAAARAARAPTAAAA